MNGVFATHRLYPDRSEVFDLLSKALHADAVPVLIARRIHYSTFSVLNHCGLIIHQTYNHLFPESELDLALAVSDKEALGYHDIRIGNLPDARLEKFLCVHLPSVLPNARAAFSAHHDLLFPFVDRKMQYKEFAARVKRRSRGLPEDLEPFEPEPDYYDY